MVSLKSGISGSYNKTTGIWTLSEAAVNELTEASITLSYSTTEETTDPVTVTATTNTSYTLQYSLDLETWYDGASYDMTENGYIYFRLTDGDEVSSFYATGYVGNIIEESSPYIGAYADVDGDGTVDGVIYADLAYSVSSYWSPGSTSSNYIEYGTYSYDAIDEDELREYYISQDSYTDTYFGTNVVLSPVEGTSGEQRFYILELENHTKNEDSEATSSSNGFRWYYGAYSSYGGTNITDYSTVTSTDFGAGITNSATFKPLWEAETYGTKNYSSSYDDVWSIDDINTNIGDTDSVWYLPSSKEWAAFADAFGITSSNYSSTYGLSTWYWSSSLCSSYYAYYTTNSGGHIHFTVFYSGYYARLGATF